jgi:CD109 antigen
VNFGEKVVIKPVVFNFWEEDIEVQLRFQTHSHLLIVGRQPHAISVQAQSSASFNLTLLTSGIGRLRIKITAVVKGKSYSDTVEKILLVKSNCLKHEQTSTIFLSGHTYVQNQVINFTLPNCALVGSHTASIVVKGDLMSLSNFDKILVVPTGCGEQNMARACINFVVATYLNSTGQLTDAFRDRITENLKLGYQRELQFAKSSGGFAVFPSLSADLWLTAFVLRSLSDIHAFCNKESFVDSGVLKTTFNYFVKSQGKTGAFEITGYSVKYGLVNNDAALTAYVMVALSRYRTDDVRKIQVLQKAANYLISSINSVDLSSMCTYTTVLTAYALAHVRSASRTTQRLLPYVKRSIKSSVDYPGTCYVCNSCTMRDDVQNDESCDEDAPSRDPITSYCVETTAYTLLTLLKVQEYEKTYCLAQWLLKQQNSFGSFGSSQDTIVGLESLSVFAQRTFTARLNLSIAVNQRGQSYSIQVTDDNRYPRQKILVSYEMKIVLI